MTHTQLMYSLNHSYPVMADGTSSFLWAIFLNGISVHNAVSTRKTKFVMAARNQKSISLPLHADDA